MGLDADTAGRPPRHFGWRALAGLFEDAWARERRRRRWLVPLALLAAAAVFAASLTGGGGNGSAKPGTYGIGKLGADHSMMGSVPRTVLARFAMRTERATRQLAREVGAHPAPVSPIAKAGFVFFDHSAHYSSDGWTFSPAVLTSLPTEVLALPTTSPPSFESDVAATELIHAPNGSTFWFVPGSKGDCLFSPDGGGGCNTLAAVDQHGIQTILQTATVSEGASVGSISENEVVGFVPNANKSISLGLIGGATETVPVVNSFYIAPSPNLCQYNVISTTDVLDSWNVRNCGS
jgi:hypothetical protein